MSDDRRILFFGDSFVAGAGDPEGRGWVGRVVAASLGAGLALTAYPLGVRRQTSVQVAARWRAEALARREPGADCRVVFSVGANDATLEDGCPRVEPATTLATFARVLDGAAELSLPAFVVGPPPSGDDEQDTRMRGLSAGMAAICAQRDVPCVSVLAALHEDPVWAAEARAGDGTHPAAGGYAALAALVLAGGWLDWLSAASPAAGAERRGG